MRERHCGGWRRQPPRHVEDIHGRGEKPSQKENEVTELILPGRRSCASRPGVGERGQGCSRVGGSPPAKRKKGQYLHRARKGSTAFGERRRIWEKGLWLGRWGNGVGTIEKDGRTCGRKCFCIEWREGTAKTQGEEKGIRIG